MTTTYCAIVSNTIKPQILAKIQEQCARVFTMDEVAQMEDEHFNQVILPYIEAQKAANADMVMRPIRQYALEIHGAQHQQDGTVKTAVSLNLSILFNITGLRTDLETGESTEAVNRYARGSADVGPTYKSGKPNTLYGSVSKYAADLAKNPKATFATNGSLNLNGTAGSGLTQQRVILNQDNSYAIFSIHTVDIEISDGTSYQIKDLDIRNAVLMSKTTTANVIEITEFDFDDILETTPTNVPAQAPMVIPAATAERRVPAVAPNKAAAPVVPARRNTTNLFG